TAELRRHLFLITDLSHSTHLFFASLFHLFFLSFTSGNRCSRMLQCLLQFVREFVHLEKRPYLTTGRRITELTEIAKQSRCGGLGSVYAWEGHMYQAGLIPGPKHQVLAREKCDPAFLNGCNLGR